MSYGRDTDYSVVVLHIGDPVELVLVSRIPTELLLGDVFLACSTRARIKG